MEYVAQFKSLSEITKNQPMVNFDIDQDGINAKDELNIEMSDKGFQIINEFMGQIYNYFFRSKNSYFLIEKIGNIFGDNHFIYKSLCKKYLKNYTDSFEIFGYSLENIMEFVQDQMYEEIWKHGEKNTNLDEKETLIIIENFKNKFEGINIIFYQAKSVRKI